MSTRKILKITNLWKFKTPLCNHHSLKPGHIPVHVCVRMYVYVTYVCKCMCVCICIYLHVYVCTYMYMYVCTSAVAIHVFAIHCLQHPVFLILQTITLYIVSYDVNTCRITFLLLSSRLKRTDERDSILPASYWRPRKRKHLMLT